MKAGVVGAGLMGAEIALVFALAGHDVLLHDRSGDALERAGLGADAGTWREVDDFGWIKTHRASPNWRVLEEGERTPAPSAPPSA